MRCTQAQRDEAVELARQIGAAEAGRRLGINANTLRSWMTRYAAGGPIEANQERRQTMAAATATKLLVSAERKTQLAANLLDDAERLRAQLFAPCIERRAMTVSGGKDFGSSIEVAEVHHDKPPFADQRQIMTSIAIAVDKILLLTGEATERIESTLVSRKQMLDEARDRAGHLRSVS